jgi:hypothetical protein
MLPAKRVWTHRNFPLIRFLPLNAISLIEFRLYELQVWMIGTENLPLVRFLPLKAAPLIELLLYELQLWMTCTGNDGCLVWGVQEKASTAFLEGPAVRWAACLEDNKTILCASGDRTTKMWDLATSSGSVALEGNRGSRVKSWDVSQVPLLVRVYPPPPPPHHTQSPKIKMIKMTNLLL